jgi:hypothetical protein
MKLSVVHTRAIIAMRASVDPEDTYNGYCYDVSEIVAERLRDAGVHAELCDAGAVRDRSHTYVITDDGTIIDATLDQFYPGGRGNRTG